MKYAHIYKAADKKFTLLITETPSIVGDPLEMRKFENKADAKKYAKSIGAKPWNY